MKKIKLLFIVLLLVIKELFDKSINQITIETRLDLLINIKIAFCFKYYRRYDYE